MFVLSSELAESVEETVESKIISWENIKEYFVGSLPDVVDFLIEVIIAIIVFLVGMRVIKFIRKILRRQMEKSKLDEALKKFLDHLTNVALYAILILMILGAFGVTASSVVAIIGSAGLSIGLALQGALSNFAGGVLILFLRPFRIGDYIAEDTSGNEGTVVDIGLFYTKLLTIDNKTVMVPNANLTGNSLTNYSGQKYRMLDQTVRISYKADLQKAKEVLLEAASGIPSRVREDEPEAPIVFVSELAEDAVVMGVRVWVYREDYIPSGWTLAEEMKLALDAAGIEIAFPQMDVNVKEKEAPAQKADF